MIDPAYPALSRTIEGSVLWRSGVAVVAALGVAWRDSMTARAAGTLRGAVGDLAALGWIGACAGVAALTAQSMLPVYARPGIPLVWPAAAIIVSATVALGAARLQRAWPQSLLARRVLPPRHER